jgi:hypothetical protein
MRNYDNPQCHSIDEFEEDLKRFLYLKKLLSRYVKNDDLKDRLILNHIIVLHNVFGDSTLNILFHKIDKECWRALITFLVYLNRMPDAVPEYGIVLSDVVLDEKIIATLRKI